MLQEVSVPAPKDRSSEGLLNTKQLAVLLNVHIGTLQQYRTNGGGPGYIKLGGCIFYTPEDIKIWLATKNIDTTNWPNFRQMKRLHRT